MQTPQRSQKHPPTNAPLWEQVTSEQLDELVRAHRVGAPAQELEGAALSASQQEELAFLVQREAGRRHLAEAAARKGRLKRYALLACVGAVALWLGLSSQPKKLLTGIDAFVRVMTWQIDESAPVATRVYIARHYSGAVRAVALTSLLRRQSNGRAHPAAEGVARQVLDRQGKAAKAAGKPIGALRAHHVMARLWKPLSAGDIDVGLLAGIMRQTKSPHVQYALATTLHKSGYLSWGDAMALYRDGQNPKIRSLAKASILHLLGIKLRGQGWHIVHAFQQALALQESGMRLAVIKLLATADSEVLVHKSDQILQVLAVALRDQARPVNRTAILLFSRWLSSFQAREAAASLRAAISFSWEPVLLQRISQLLERLQLQ